MHRLRLAVVCAILSLPWPGPAHAAGGGTIRGHVRLATAGMANPIIRMGADPACSQLWSGERPTQAFVVRGAEGQLANVFVKVQGEFPPTPVPAAPVVIVQRRCLYQPHVVGVRAGQSLEIRNSDPTTHNVHSRSSAGNDVNVSQAVQSPALMVMMTHPEPMLRLTCDVHAWMNIFVAVMSHPYFAVTDAAGQFEIAGVPPGTQRLEVWHERYGPQTVDVDVAGGGVREVDVTYAGTENPAPMR